MKVTVCQLHDEPESLAEDWQGLVAHIKAENSELVLLPEMPFFPWFGGSRTFDPVVWNAAVETHAAWTARFAELSPASVLGTRPITVENKRHNSGFAWTAGQGLKEVHRKVYLPDEDGVWEASWYHPGTQGFAPFTVKEARAGFLICTEIWAMEQARLYGKHGVQLLVTPRLTEDATFDKWLAAGRVTSVVAGAFGLSSNRTDRSGRYGGQGWIIDPDGAVLGLTSRETPFITRDLDLTTAIKARDTYPRYAFD